MSCGTTGIDPLPPDTDPPNGEAAHIISGRVVNRSQLETGDELLWVAAYRSDGQSLYFPNLPQGRISANSVFQFELPLEVDKADLQDLTSSCGSGIQISDPDAAGVLVPVLVLPSERFIIQATSSTYHSLPSNGSILVLRFYTDRDVRIEGTCRGGLLRGAVVDLDLRLGWNFVTARIKGLPFAPTLEVRSGTLPKNVGWYFIGF